MSTKLSFYEQAWSFLSYTCHSAGWSFSFALWSAVWQKNWWNMGFINQRQNAKQAKIYKLRLSEKSEQNFVNMTKEFCNACIALSKGCSLSWGQMRLFNTRDKMNTSMCTSPSFLSMCYTTNVGGGNSYEERGGLSFWLSNWRGGGEKGQTTSKLILNKTLVWA